MRTKSRLRHMVTAGAVTTYPFCGLVKMCMLYWSRTYVQFWLVVDVICLYLILFIYLSYPWWADMFLIYVHLFSSFSYIFWLFQCVCYNFNQMLLVILAQHPCLRFKSLDLLQSLRDFFHSSSAWCFLHCSRHPTLGWVWSTAVSKTCKKWKDEESAEPLVPLPATLLNNIEQ